jgi:hypothetical protein
MAKVLFLVAALSCLLYIACAKTYIDKAIALSSSTEGVSTLADREATGAGCNCSSILCQCCINVDIPIPPIHESLCAKLVWLQKAFGVAIRVDAGSNNMLFEMIYNTTYPAKCLNVRISTQTFFSPNTMAKGLFFCSGSNSACVLTDFWYSFLAVLGPYCWRWLF